VRVENPPEGAVDLEATFASFAEAHGLQAAAPAADADHAAPLDLRDPLPAEAPAHGVEPLNAPSASLGNELRGTSEARTASSGEFQLADQRF
jgi:hypothetical protein